MTIKNAPPTEAAPDETPSLNPDLVRELFFAPLFIFLGRVLPRQSALARAAGEVLDEILRPSFLWDAPRFERPLRELVWAVARRKARDERRLWTGDSRLEVSETEACREFDRALARQVMVLARARLRAECDARELLDEDVLHLHYERALPIEEVARRIGRGRGTTGLMLHRARRRLRRHFEGVLAEISPPGGHAPVEAKHLLTLLARRLPPGPSSDFVVS